MVLSSVCHYVAEVSRPCSPSERSPAAITLPASAQSCVESVKVCGKAWEDVKKDFKHLHITLDIVTFTISQCHVWPQWAQTRHDHLPASAQCCVKTERGAIEQGH